MTDKYILNGKETVPCNNLTDWAEWMENHDRTVGKTMVKDILISTVFIGLNHNFLNPANPLLFETMIFGGKHDPDCRRYSTWEEAQEGHKKIVKLVENNI